MFIRPEQYTFRSFINQVTKLIDELANSSNRKERTAALWHLINRLPRFLRRSMVPQPLVNQHGCPGTTDVDHRIIPPRSHPYGSQWDPVSSVYAQFNQEFYRISVRRHYFSPSKFTTCRPRKT